jgi:DNA polymerase-3 subunit epsilon
LIDLNLMSRELIAIIDVETTGLSPWRNDRIVEIGIVVMTPDGIVQNEYETLVNPCRDIGPSLIHHISASDVSEAPRFREIAGDILCILANANVVAGHNVGFDMNFLVKEFERLGVAIPEIPVLCTCHLLGRNSLKSCCEELGIVFDGMPHRALSDARATSRLVSSLCDEDPEILKRHIVKDISWPKMTALQTPCFCREHAERKLHDPPRFLQRIANLQIHDVDALPTNLIAYLALIDRILEDRMIDAGEENTIVDAAVNWGISARQLDSAHRQYMESLIFHVLADGIVSESERGDLHAVARLLGQDANQLDLLLESASSQLASASSHMKARTNHDELHGQRVCFTGELQCRIDGQPISRNLAETLAARAGLTVKSTVTKNLDLLVVADPNTQSGKAKKARDYGIRILSDAVFWRMAGVTVD